MNLTSAYSQMTLFRQRLFKERSDLKQKLLKKSSKKREE